MRRLILTLFLVLCAGSLPARAQDVDTVEIVVTGRQPGPPLWRVINGEHTLWILPIVSPVPRDITWENDRVAAIITNADEAIGMPDISFGVSKLVKYNPINIIRGIRLYNRLRRNPDDRTLADVLPADTYRRFAALKARYFPDNEKIETLRPFFASDTIASEIHDHEKLVSSEVITMQIERLIRRDKDITYTDVKLTPKLEGGYRSLSRRAENLLDSMNPEYEIGCLDTQLTNYERHLDDIKEVANAWATGVARDLEDFLLPDSMEEPCAALFVQSTEGDMLTDMVAESRDRWFNAAVAALERNGSTFTMLPIALIVGDMSLVDRLVARGYQVRAPQ